MSARRGRLSNVGHIEVGAVDERDSSWEDSAPRFRVYLHSSGAKTTYGSTWTFDIMGADVLQVIDWAQRQAGDQLTYAVALVRDDAEEERRNPGHSRGLVWLVGMDGNDTTEDSAEERAIQERMLARRAHPVVVPPADVMPAGVPGPFSDGGDMRPEG